MSQEMFTFCHNFLNQSLILQKEQIQLPDPSDFFLHTLIFLFG